MDGAGAGPSPAHVLLRESTRAAHAAAEASTGMRRLLAGELDPSGYQMLLAAHRALFREWETKQASWLAGDVAAHGWHYVSRASRLHDDLASMAPGARDAVAAYPFARLDAGSTAATPGAAWGELYVIEGSALGGRLIVRRLRALFPDLPHRFYAIAEHDAPPWRHFQRILDSVLTDDALRRAAVEGATRMFARFQQVLQDDPRHV